MASPWDRGARDRGTQVARGPPTCTLDRRGSCPEENTGVQAWHISTNWWFHFLSMSILILYFKLNVLLPLTDIVFFFSLALCVTVPMATFPLQQ